LKYWLKSSATKFARASAASAGTHCRHWWSFPDVRPTTISANNHLTRARATFRHSMNAQPGRASDRQPESCGNPAAAARIMVIIVIVQAFPTS
jgi:hypothetical protein